MKSDRAASLARQATEHMLVAARAVQTPYMAPKGRTIAAAQDRVIERAEGMGSCPSREQACQAIEAARALWWQLALTEWAIAHAWARKLHPYGGAPLEDAEQEGRLALFEAARRFDPDNGATFATHARWWVRALLTKARSREDLIRTPYRFDEARMLAHAHDLQGPELAEAAAAIGLPLDDFRAALAGSGHRSLDAPVGTFEDDNLTLHDEIGHDPTERVERAVDIERALVGLPDNLREIALMAARGLDSRAIAREVGVTRWTIAAWLARAERIITERNQELHDDED